MFFDITRNNTHLMIFPIKSSEKVLCIASCRTDDQPAPPRTTVGFLNAAKLEQGRKLNGAKMSKATHYIDGNAGCYGALHRLDKRPASPREDGGKETSTPW